MKTRQVLLVAASPLLLLLVAGCQGSESDARAYLEQQGYSPTSVTKEAGGGFRFVAKKDKNICSGVVTIKKSPGSSQQTMTSGCELDTSACKAGAPKECMTIANELYEKDAKIFPKKAAELYRLACADKDALACARVAEFESIEKNWPAVREFATKGCDLGSGEGCRLLAHSEREGQGTPKNEAKAIDLAKKACELSSIAGCRDAAGMMVDANPSRATEAIPLAEKACKAKFQDSCAALGIAMFDAKKDYPVALEHLETACNSNAKTASTPGFVCNIAGAIVLDGLGGVKKDPARGIALLEKSCTQEFAAGCSNAGRMYVGGLNGVPKNKSKGDDLLLKACGLGHKSACKT